MAVAVKTIVTDHGRMDWKISLLSNPFQASVGLLFVINGFKVLLAFCTHNLAATGLDFVPTWVVLWWAFGIFHSGLGVLAVCFTQPKTSRGRALEKASLLLGGATWASYALALLLLIPSAWDGYLGTLGITVACLLRIRAISRVEKALARAVEEGAT